VGSKPLPWGNSPYPKRLQKEDYSLHYFSSEASFKETDLIQVLNEQYERNTR
jgi:hypothetical protein